MYVIGNTVAIRRTWLETCPELCTCTLHTELRDGPVIASVVARLPPVEIHAAQHQSDYTQGPVVHASVAMAAGGERFPTFICGMMINAVILKR